MTDESDRTALAKATDAVLGATAAVQATTDSIASAIESGRAPGGVLNQLSRFTREEPLCSVAIAFMAGLLFARLQ